MYKKTSSANFLKYGQPINSLPKDHELMLNHVSINDKTITEFMCFDEDIYLSLDEGMGMLIIYDHEYLEYAIHRNLRINRGVIFALVPMNDNITITLYTPSNVSFKKIIAPSPYTYRSVTHLSVLMRLLRHIMSSRAQVTGLMVRLIIIMN